MKRILLGLAAVATLAAAAPAFAHDHDDDDDAWSVRSYDDFGREYRHIWQGIQHGLSDGSYTPREAQHFYGELQAIRERADWDARRGVYDADEMEARLQRLHYRMHIAHERGHERMDDGRYSDWSGGYRYTPYDPYRR